MDLSNVTFGWREVLFLLRECAPYLVVLLIHNFLLAPLLLRKQRKGLYFSLVAVSVVLFTCYQCTNRPDDRHRRGPRHEMADRHRPSALSDGHRPPMPDGERSFPHPDGNRRHPLVSPHDVTAVIVLILMLIANIGVKLYFRQRRDQLKMARLEKQNLEQQLEYLKYQLNPHFLMNTLNNIHALVDIDGERAKEAVIQLSKILRYVLYESNRERVPMAKEAEFMENYTHLMRIRYTDRLRFTVSQPDDIGGIVVPPLLFISFVENAFKHGVSYQQDSYIDISCQRLKGKGGEDRLLWSCRNSKHPKPDTDTGSPRQGGVGLANVRQRLDLIYGDNYTLSVNDDEKKYEVILDIPVEA